MAVPAEQLVTGMAGDAIPRRTLQTFVSTCQWRRSTLRRQIVPQRLSKDKIATRTCGCSGVHLGLEARGMALVCLTLPQPCTCLKRLSQRLGEASGALLDVSRAISLLSGSLRLSNALKLTESVHGTLRTRPRTCESTKVWVWKLREAAE